MFKLSLSPSRYQNNASFPISVYKSCWMTICKYLSLWFKNFLANIQLKVNLEINYKPRVRFGGFIGLPHCTCCLTIRLMSLTTEWLTQAHNCCFYNYANKVRVFIFLYIISPGRCYLKKGLFSFKRLRSNALQNMLQIIYHRITRPSMIEAQPTSLASFQST